jgi:hypothetical protein
MSLALPQRYQISERDIPQRLAVYHGRGAGGLRKVAGIHASPCRVGLIGRDIQNYAARYRCSGDFARGGLRGYCRPFQ